MSFLERTKAIERRRKELEKRSRDQEPRYAGRSRRDVRWQDLRALSLHVSQRCAPGVCPARISWQFWWRSRQLEWPRHTGDFSFMRAYTAPDGSSADYSAKNVPYKPKRFIQVAPGGADEGDFIFILGYPGRTSRHKTASFLNYEEQVRLPYIASLYAWEIAQLEAAGKDDRAVALKLAAQIRSLANVEKRARGQLKGMRRATIAATRTAEEQRCKSSSCRSSAQSEVWSNVVRYCFRV